MKTKTYLLVIFLFFILQSIIAQQDGTLDVSFGDGGIVKTSIGDKNYSFDSVIDPNGKQITVGTTITNENSNFGIVRYNKDGSLDNSFGEQGKVNTPIGIHDDHARSVLIDKNGKIVVAGFTQVIYNEKSRFDFVVARYNSDGSLDESFGKGGNSIFPVSREYDFGSSVVLDNSDGLIVAGLTEQSGQFDLGLIRFNSDGSLDKRFGEHGKTITELGLPLKLTNNPVIGTDKMAVIKGDLPWIEILPDVVIGKDEKIIVAATALVDSKLICSVSRYYNNGSIDISFGNNGIVTTSISNGADYSAEVLIDIQGKILLLANAENDCSFGFALVRYNEDGSLDENYGENGIADFGYECSYNTGKDAVIDSLGRVIVAVNSNGEDESVLMLYRVTEDGYTDDSFDEDGIVETLFDDTKLFPESINLESTGQIVVAGVAGNLYEGNAEFLAVRYNGSTPPLVGDTIIVDPPRDDDGDLDLSYGINGFAYASVSKVDICTDSKIDSEGRMVLAGYTSFGTKIAKVIRFKVDGILDNSFGEDGIVSLPDLENSFKSPDIGNVYSLDIDTEGRIIIVGSKYITDSYDIVVARLLSNGNLDDSFGEGGILFTNLNYNDYATDVVVGKGNKITVVGYSTNDSWKKIILTRYKVDGSLDESFGANGITTVVDDAEIIETDLAIDSFERILVRTDRSSLYRFKKNGSSDITFGNNGIVDIQTPYNKISLRNMTIDLEDRIILLANGIDGENSGAFLVRYNIDGSVDNNFGHGGFTDVAWGKMLYEGIDLVVNENGGILVAAIYDEGLEHNWTKRGDISMLAYTEDGWTDDRFNDDGIVETEISESAELVKFIGINPEGNIFIAGTKMFWVNTSLHHDFFAAKYFGSAKAGEAGANVGSKNYAMNQNYPNPFNPSTVIRFKIPADNNVTLKVFNMLGQEVATLVNEYKSAGLYKVTFDATDLPSGIYVYRLDTGSFTEVHKMLLLK